MFLEYFTFLLHKLFTLIAQRTLTPVAVIHRSREKDIHRITSDDLMARKRERLL